RSPRVCRAASLAGPRRRAVALVDRVELLTELCELCSQFGVLRALHLSGGGGPTEALAHESRVLGTLLCLGDLIVRDFVVWVGRLDPRAERQPFGPLEDLAPAPAFVAVEADDLALLAYYPDFHGCLRF